MNLTFAEDFSSEAVLDSELLGTPLSGLYWNRGVHPTLTVDNLLTMLPIKQLTFADWDAAAVYGEFNTSRKKSDVVTLGGKIYQSIEDTNEGNDPAAENSAYWLETNLDSLRIKSFIWTVDDNVLSALTLNRMLIENQYIYNIGESTKTIAEDFFGWVYEPKGSDYVTIRINQIAIQSESTDPLSLYVVNQGVLIDTLAITPDNGRLEFEDLGYTFKGKGPFYFILEGGIDVLAGEAYNDPLKYSGFVCYPVTGIGATAEDAEYSIASSSNGLSFNVSCYLDSSTYIENNKVDLSPFYRVQFEYDFIRMTVHDSNNRFNAEERIMSKNPELLAAESLDMRGATIAKKYSKELKRTTEVINKTFDKFLRKKQGLRVKRRVL